MIQKIKVNPLFSKYQNTYMFTLLIEHFQVSKQTLAGRTISKVQCNCFIKVKIIKSR